MPQTAAEAYSQLEAEKTIARFRELKENTTRELGEIEGSAENLLSDGEGLTAEQRNQLEDVLDCAQTVFPWDL